MWPRQLTKADLPAAIALLDKVGLAGGALNLARYLRWQPDGAWGIDLEGAPEERWARSPRIDLEGAPEERWARSPRPDLEGAPEERWARSARPDLEGAPEERWARSPRPALAATEDPPGRLVGVVTVLRHGEVGFVGCMAVDPALHGRGIGRRVLEHAQLAARRAGVTTLLLEATALGARLYRRLGYVAEHESAICGRAATGPSDTTSIVADRAPILALDRAATGARRDPMIGGLLDEAEGAVARVGGELAGYGLVVANRLGPVIARDPGAGRALLDRLAPACTSACVPLPNEPAVAALAAHGFVEQRRVVRMRLGPPVAVRTSWIWALASPGAG